MEVYHTMNAEEWKEQIAKDIKEHSVVLYMKGSKEVPVCGFSLRAKEILDSYNVPYFSRDVLSSDIFKQALKDFSNWPTFPQLYINGKLIGGCDIMMQMHQNGELGKLLEGVCSKKD